MQNFIIFFLLFTFNNIYAEMRLLVKNNLPQTAIVRLSLLDFEQNPIESKANELDENKFFSRDLKKTEKPFRNNIYYVLLTVTLDKLPSHIKHPDIINIANLLEIREISRNKVLDRDSVSQIVKLRCHNNPNLLVIHFSINKAPSTVGSLISYPKQFIDIPSDYKAKYFIVNVAF